MTKSENALFGEAEKKIIEAATIVFVEKGRTGTSMQDIADEAGINRTLLNYYFRTKDKLFTTVFEKVFMSLLMEAIEVLNSDKDILSKFDSFIDVYINGLLKNPHIPIFILNELTGRSDYMIRLFKSSGLRISNFHKEIQVAMDEGRIIPMETSQLIINFISMIIFPFAAKPIVSGMILSEQEVEFDEFMKDRIPSLKKYFLKSITP